MFNKHRLGALSDGIFAIVMTLLVLDLIVPEGVLPKHVGLTRKKKAALEARVRPALTS